MDLVAEPLVTEGPFGDPGAPGLIFARRSVPALPRHRDHAPLEPDLPHDDRSRRAGTARGLPHGKAVERIFLPLVRMMIPELVDYDLPTFGVFHNVAFISIKKT